MSLLVARARTEDGGGSATEVSLRMPDGAVKDRRRFEVAGVEVDALTTPRACDAVEGLIESKSGGYVVFCTASTVLSAHDDTHVRKALADAALVTPDGMPLVWLGKRQVREDVERVYGPDFLLEFMRRTGDRYSHFFYGGEAGTSTALVERLMREVPQLRVAGSLEPPMGIDPFEPPRDDIDRINTSSPDVVWVGLGHPKQELFMWATRSLVTAPVQAGVGAAFDYLSGRKKEAPAWMKRSGLQWLHRLAFEPRRLWRRYLIGNSRFIGLAIKSRAFSRRS